MKDIPGYEGVYAVTEEGFVWTYPKPNRKGWKDSRILKTFLIGHGYKIACLYKNKEQKKFLVHRLVAQSYIPNPLSLKEVNHKNGDRTDNRVENLEWVSSKENKSHAWKSGLYSHSGEKHWKCAIPDSEVMEMRKLFKEGKTTKQIADYFSRNYFTTRGILMNKSRHID